MSRLKNIVEVSQYENDEVDTNTKKVSLYALDTGDITKKRLTGTANGDKLALDVNIIPGTIATEETLQSIAGMQIPAYDTMTIDETDPNSIVITYKKDTVTVAVKNISVVGAVTTISI